MTLKVGIRARLEHLLVPEKLQRVEVLAREIEELARELDEARGQIPLWDRVFIYDVTPDEERAESIMLSLEPRRKVLRELRKEIDAAFERVGHEFPPFGVGVAAERCFRLAREHLRVEGFLTRHVAEQDALTEALQDLADRVIETWVRDFEPTHLFRTLSDPDRCEAAAAAEELDAHDPDARLGVAPITERHLLALVARRLREGEFFAERKKLKDLQHELSLLEATLERVDENIPWRSRLNPFQSSSAHLRRDELRERRAVLDEATRRQFETTRRRLHQALTAYPPLAIHQRAVEAAGVAKLLGVEWERNLSRAGDVVDRELIAPRALVFAALSRLLETFVAVFPDVPLPLQVLQEMSDPALGRRRSPRELLIREFQQRLDASWAAELRDQALEHAGMEGSLARRRTRAQSGSLVERIVSWSDPLRRRRQERLAERGAWHGEAALESWTRLLGAARTVAGTLAPLAARDLAIHAADELAGIHVDPGDAPFPPARTIEGQHQVLGTLSTLARTLGKHYGLRGTRAELLAALVEHPPTEPPADLPFEPRPYAEVLVRLAGKLDQGALRAAYARVVEGLPPPDEHGYSAWDQADLGGGVATLDPALRTKLHRVQRLLEAAFDAYPPARLYYSLDGVRAQVRALRVEVRELQQRGLRRYRAELVGLPAAQSALRRWCARLVATFGELPDTHELLQRWALRGIEDSGWELTVPV